MVLVEVDIEGGPGQGAVPQLDNEGVCQNLLPHLAHPGLKFVAQAHVLGPLLGGG